jgi:hypothetical protein
MAQWQPAPEAPKEGEPTEGLELSEDRWQLLPAASEQSADEGAVPMAAAWEFIQWQQPAAEPAPPPEESVPLAQPWEMAQWQPETGTAPAPEQPLTDEAMAPLAEPLPTDATVPPEDEPPVPAHIAPELLAHERLVPEPIEDNSDTSPYGLRTVSSEEARAELETEAPSTPKPGEPEER